MRAAYLTRIVPTDPLQGLEVGDLPDPSPPGPDWTTVSVRAAALNRHDLWTLQGSVGALPRLPLILGSDGAGVDDTGRDVVIYPVLGDAGRGGGDETLDPECELLSTRTDGTLAERVVVPRRNLVEKPAGLTYEEAAAIPTAWLTAYRMLFTKAGLKPGQSVLIQGVGGGVASAALLLASAAGLRVFVTSRDEVRRARALSLGANLAVAPGVRLPERVDAVIETVGAASFEHSLKSVRSGGTIVVAGATSGRLPTVDLAHLFHRQVRIVGSRTGTLAEFRLLLEFLKATGVRPLIDSVHSIDDAPAAFARLARGENFGKLIVRVDQGVKA